MNDLLKPLLAELLGTFTLVFVGAAAVAVTNVTGYDVTVPALAHGLILVGLIFTYGHLSGAHFNPAVTLGLLVGGHVKIDRAVFYWIAQFVGAILAALLLKFTFDNVPLPEGDWSLGETAGMLTTSNVWVAAIIEGLLAFLLVSVIYQAAVYGKAGNLAPLAIGLTLAGLIFAAGALTGASANPARTLGPALIAGNLDYLLPYLIGLFAGGALAGALHTFLLKPEA